MAQDNERFVRMALDEARKAQAAGDEPFGCVILLDGEVVAQGRNQVNTSKDATAHSETMTIRAATAALGRRDLSGCVLYTNWEPCQMCAGTILEMKVDTVIMGGREGFPGDYRIEKLLEAAAQWGSPLNLVTGVLQKECEEVVMGWWKRAS